eukprot:2755820-Rhodomonas_salina.1
MTTVGYGDLYPTTFLGYKFPVLRPNHSYCLPLTRTPYLVDLPAIRSSYQIIRTTYQSSWATGTCILLPFSGTNAPYYLMLRRSACSYAVACDAWRSSIYICCYGVAGTYILLPFSGTNAPVLPTNPPHSIPVIQAPYLSASNSGENAVIYGANGAFWVQTYPMICDFRYHIHLSRKWRHLCAERAIYAEKSAIYGESAAVYSDNAAVFGGSDHAGGDDQPRDLEAEPDAARGESHRGAAKLTGFAAKLTGFAAKLT